MDLSDINAEIFVQGIKVKFVMHLVEMRDVEDLKEQNNLFAYGTIYLDNWLVVSNTKLYCYTSGEKVELFLAFPKRKTTHNGEIIWKDVIAVSDEVKKEIAEKLYRYLIKTLQEVYLVNVNAMNIKVTENKRGGNVKAIAAVTINGITIYNIRIMEGPRGLFIRYPQYLKKENGREIWKNLIYVWEPYMRDTIQRRVIEQYEKLISGGKI